MQGGKPDARGSTGANARTNVRTDPRTNVKSKFEAGARSEVKAQGKFEGNVGGRNGRGSEGRGTGRPGAAVRRDERGERDVGGQGRDGRYEGPRVESGGGAGGSGGPVPGGKRDVILQSPNVSIGGGPVTGEKPAGRKRKNSLRSSRDTGLINKQTLRDEPEVEDEALLTDDAWTVRRGKPRSVSSVNSMAMPGGVLGRFPELLQRAAALRAGMRSEAVRLMNGLADGMDGVYIDRYGPGVVVNVYEGKAPTEIASSPRIAEEVLTLLEPLGVSAVYTKIFPRDRSKMGGEMPARLLDATPGAGEALPEALTLREHSWKLEARLYDGYSTGLFLDQRENRKFIHDWCAKRKGKVSLLNTFAYTCGFSVAAATAGAATFSVDVSAKYLAWGKRNFEHNGLELSERHKFYTFDTFDFFAYASRKGLTFDIIVLDPPSFSSANKRKKIQAFSSVDHYAGLLHEAAALLRPRGIIFASTNTIELCRPGRFERMINEALDDTRLTYIPLPAPPRDFAGDKERFEARCFMVT
jgi:23S rRNA G2069 N7-methylase RlmK/C1962 C5-methylase RlmI